MNERITAWLDTAVSGIRFDPDRDRVRKELEAHMEDKLAGLRRSFPDIPEEEAQERILAGMGDAEELKRSLAEVHKPWTGYLWRASQVLLCVMLVVLLLFGMEINYNTLSFFTGVEHTPIYHRIYNGEKARLGGYTFQITGAAHLECPDELGDLASLQVGLRVSSPKFWERIDPDALYNNLTAAGPNGKAQPMNRAAIVGRSVTDAQGLEIYSQRYWIGAELSSWTPWYLELAVYVPAEDWTSGGLVTLWVDSEAGSIQLSVPVTEEVVLK